MSLCGPRLRSANASEEETRRAITERIQDELMKLRDHTHRLMQRTPRTTSADDAPLANGKLNHNHNHNHESRNHNHSRDDHKEKES